MAEETFGFVCPDWAKEVWNKNECTVEPSTDGTFVVLDHSIQTVVYRGKTDKECLDWLGNDADFTRLDMAFFAEDMETFFDLLAEKKGPGAVVDFIEEGGFATCPHCLEHYWSEDGHPRGTLCPKFGEENQPEPKRVEEEVT